MIISVNEGHGPINFTLDFEDMFFYFFLHPLLFGYDKVHGFWFEINRCFQCKKIWGLDKHGCRNCRKTQDRTLYWCNYCMREANQCKHPVYETKVQRFDRIADRK